MKKLLAFSLAIITVVTLSCQKENHPSDPDEVQFSLKSSLSDSPFTKTYIEELDVDGISCYYPFWNNGDKIACFFTKTTKQVDIVLTNTEKDGDKASFEGTATGVSDGTIYSVYPSSCINTVYGTGSVRVDIPAKQYPSYTSFDPKADILVAKPADFIVVDQDGVKTASADDLYFKRIMSVLKVNLSGSTAANLEYVNTFSLSVDQGNICGGAKVDMETAEILSWPSTRDEVTAVYTQKEVMINAAGANSVYLVVAPGTIAAGCKLSFTIKTDNHIIVKPVTLTSDLVLPANDIATINISLPDTYCKELGAEDYSGEYVIIGTDDSHGYYAMDKYESGKNSCGGIAVTYESGKVTSTSDISSCKLTISKVGTIKGYYTIKDAGNLYLYAASNSANQLKGEQELDKYNNAYWWISEENGNWTVKADLTTNRGVLRNNYNGGNVIFSCYESATNKPVILVPWKDVTLPTLYNVEIGTIENGTVTANPSSAPEGTTVTLTPTPASDDYEFEAFTVTNKTDNSSVAVSSNNSFVMPASDVSVSCSFKKKNNEELSSVVFGGKWNDLFGTEYDGTFSLTKNALSLSGTSNGVTLTVVNGSSTAGYCKDDDFRCYSNYKMTISAGEGKTIKSISTTKGGKTFTGGIAANTGTSKISASSYSWSGSSSSVVLTISATVSFATITVQYSSSGNSETDPGTDPGTDPEPTPACATPSISCSSNSVTISCETEGASIYYTITGETPTTSSSRYSTAFSITSNVTVKAYAVKEGYTDSSVAEKVCSYVSSDSYSLVNTSNITLSNSGGTNFGACKVVIDGVEYDGLKAGTSSNSGKMRIVVPDGKTKLCLHLAGWKGGTVKLKVTGASPSSLSLNADDGVTSSSPFSLKNSSVENFYQELTVNANTTYVYLETTAKEYRFIAWGINAL